MYIIDLHCDTLLRLIGQEGAGEKLFKNDRCVDISRLKKSHYWIQCFAAFIELDSFPAATKMEQGYEQAMRMFDIFDEACGLHPELFCKVTSYEEAEKAKESGKVGGMLTVEEAGFIDRKTERFDVLYDRGVRLITLLWNTENCLGYPNSNDPVIMNKGLKDFGIEAVEYMNEKGILIDVSHMNDGGFWDVVKYSTKPFLASHSNCREVLYHPRNLSDPMLKAIGERGGVVGLNFLPAFLGRGEEAGSIRAMKRHIRHLVDTAGIEAAAIGTDFDGFHGSCEISGAGEMRLLIEALEEEGYSGSEIEKIMYGNAERLFREVL